MAFVRGDATVRVTSLPGRHAPGVLSRALPPVMGSMIEFGSVRDERRMHLYITGDTLVYDKLREIAARYPDVDLALLHLGGTRVLGLLVTMDARQGVEMMRMINPRRAIPIHYNDYKVFTSPIEDFQAGVRDAGYEDRMTYLAHGDTYTFDVPRTTNRATRT